MNEGLLSNMFMCSSAHTGSGETLKGPLVRVEGAVLLVFMLFPSEHNVGDKYTRRRR